MEFDLSRLRLGERIAAIGGVVLFFLLFFDWYDVSAKVSVGGFSQSGTVASVTAWDAFDFTDLFLLLTAVVAVGLAVLTAVERTPALPVTASVVTTAIAGIATLLILFRIVDTPGGGSRSGFGATASVDVSPTIWAFVALVVAGGIAYGGYRSMRDEGTTLGDVHAQARAAFDSAAPPSTGGQPGASASSAPPPPPPPPASEPPTASPSPAASPPPSEPPSPSQSGPPPAFS